MRVRHMSDDLFRKRAADEDGCMISAIGQRLLLDHRHEGSQQRREPIREPARLAFSTLISYRRRALRLTMENLAAKAHVELDELLRIEDDGAYVPEPRTVHQLAHELKLPLPQLLVLSGNATSASAELTAASVRFAARSRAVEKLNRQENDALNEFVKILTEHKTGSEHK